MKEILNLVFVPKEIRVRHPIFVAEGGSVMLSIESPWLVIRRNEPHQFGANNNVNWKQRQYLHFDDWRVRVIALLNSHFTSSLMWRQFRRQGVFDQELKANQAPRGHRI